MPGVFSGGSYDEVGRWLRIFLTSHAKREDPRVEVLVDAGREREGKTYGVRLRTGDALSPVVDYVYSEVAANRGNLAWCRTEAERTRARARDLLAAGRPAPAR